MQAKVQLIYRERPARELSVTVRDGLKGQKLLTAVEHAVEKAAKDDTDWTRWNLLTLE